jgi:hypothetical protein
MDITKLRVVSEAFGRTLKAQLQPDEQDDADDDGDDDCKEVGSRHFLQCPRNKTEDGSMVRRCLKEYDRCLKKYDPPDNFDYYGVCVGLIYDVSSLDADVLRLFPEARMCELLLVGSPKALEGNTRSINHQEEESTKKNNTEEQERFK